MQDARFAVVALFLLVNLGYVLVLLRYRTFGASVPSDSGPRQASAALPGADGHVVAPLRRVLSRRRSRGSDLRSTESPRGRHATPPRPIEHPAHSAAATAPLNSRLPRWAGWP